MADITDPKLAWLDEPNPRPTDDQLEMLNEASDEFYGSADADDWAGE